MIRDRKILFWQEGGKRTAAWKKEKERTDAKILERKKEYVKTQKGHILAEDARCNFFKHVKNFNTIEKPRQFDVRDLRPGVPDVDIVEELATYFNRVSEEFEPLQPCQIPSTFSHGLPELMPHEVSTRIRRFCKPKSMVKGDIFPSLMTNYSDFFALPLASIYNEILRTFVWPTCWKREFVTVIPKKTGPQDFSDLRNISCTMLASKIFESYVLDMLKAQVRLRPSQYGGIKGLGTEHVLVQIWQTVLEDLDDYRAGSLITSIDYAKAFNRMSFQECLRALAAKGASTEVIRLVATFLTNRTMSVRVADTWSAPRPVCGGCPQGSILGVFLFNSTIDDIEKGCQDLEEDGHDDEQPAEDESTEDDEAEDTPEDEPDIEGDLTHRNSSTPIRRGTGRSPDPWESPILPLHGTKRKKRSFFIKTRRRPRRLNITGEGRVDPPEEPNHRTEAKWRGRKGRLKRFVDDGFTLTAVNFENSIGFCVNGKFWRSKHAVQAQNIFRHLVRGPKLSG